LPTSHLEGKLYPMQSSYDVIVVGAGHAGNEAAFAAANLGCRVLLLCTNLNCVAMMPCNPSVGGPGKGHLVREIHSLGGMISRFVDETYLQIRELNESRGPAVRALRAQSDKKLYHLHVKHALEQHPGIDLVQSEVTSLLHEGPEVKGVETITGLQFYSSAVILATGTFLNGKIIIGDSRVDGGPSNEAPSLKLTSSLSKLGIEIHRLQTATPPRVSGTSINFTGLKELCGHENIRTFTGINSRPNQRSCYLTYTNSKTIGLVQHHLKSSPLKIGNITQHGPRHCPSIDRKVLNFPDQDVHQIFLEPESDFYDEWYLQGLTTSMPPTAQEEIVHSVKGLENAHIVRYGYAIEYDAIRATQLLKTCEHKKISGLFTCGQINGTSGYEEAAAQGLIAGINASRKVRNEPPFVLPITSSYLGTLMDELVTNDRDEPLRVTTSSSEFRLHLRSDNAEERLCKVGYELGLVPEYVYHQHCAQGKLIEEEIQRLQDTIITPTKSHNKVLRDLGSTEFKKPLAFCDLLSRPELSYRDLCRFSYEGIEDPSLIEKIEIRLKYSSFLKKLHRRIQYVNELDSMLLSPNIDFFSLQPGLKEETCKKLQTVIPHSVGQASRIKGIQSSEVAILIHELREGRLFIESRSL
jgi:tRNA uridine 5-carboxymethylaminomethyl modification enzyme